MQFIYRKKLIYLYETQVVENKRICFANTSLHWCHSTIDARDSQSQKYRLHVKKYINL